MTWNQPLECSAQDSAHWVSWRAVWPDSDTAGGPDPTKQTNKNKQELTHNPLTSQAEKDDGQRILYVTRAELASKLEDAHDGIECGCLLKGLIRQTKHSKHPQSRSGTTFLGGVSFLPSAACRKWIVPYKAHRQTQWCDATSEMDAFTKEKQPLQLFEAWLC